MLISTIIKSIDSASTITGSTAVIIAVSIIITVSINSIGIVTRKSIRIIMLIMKVMLFHFSFSQSAAFQASDVQTAEKRGSDVFSVSVMKKYGSSQ